MRGGNEQFWGGVIDYCRLMGCGFPANRLSGPKKKLTGLYIIRKYGLRGCRVYSVGLEVVDGNRMHHFLIIVRRVLRKVCILKIAPSNTCASLMLIGFRPITVRRMRVTRHERFFIDIS
jgi:hypothetical protein